MCMCKNGKAFFNISTRKYPVLNARRTITPSPDSPDSPDSPASRYFNAIVSTGFACTKYRCLMSSGGQQV
jgi:hypothetical protein